MLAKTFPNIVIKHSNKPNPIFPSTEKAWVGFCAAVARTLNCQGKHCALVKKDDIFPANINCSKSTMQTLEKSVTYVQS